MPERSRKRERRLRFNSPEWKAIDLSNTKRTSRIRNAKSDLTNLSLAAPRLTGFEQPIKSRASDPYDSPFRAKDAIEVYAREKRNRSDVEERWGNINESLIQSPTRQSPLSKNEVQQALGLDPLSESASWLKDSPLSSMTEAQIDAIGLNTDRLSASGALSIMAENIAESQLSRDLHGLATAEQITKEYDDNLDGEEIIRKYSDPAGISQEELVYRRTAFDYIAMQEIRAKTLERIKEQTEDPQSRYFGKHPAVVLEDEMDNNPNRWPNRMPRKVDIDKWLEDILAEDPESKPESLYSYRNIEGPGVELDSSGLPITVPGDVSYEAIMGRNIERNLGAWRMMKDLRSHPFGMFSQMAYWAQQDDMPLGEKINRTIFGSWYEAKNTVESIISGITPGTRFDPLLDVTQPRIDPEEMGGGVYDPIRMGDYRDISLLLTHPKFQKSVEDISESWLFNPGEPGDALKRITSGIDLRGQAITNLRYKMPGVDTPATGMPRNLFTDYDWKFILSTGVGLGGVVYDEKGWSEAAKKQKEIEARNLEELTKQFEESPIWQQMLKGSLDLTLLNWGRHAAVAGVKGSIAGSKGIYALPKYMGPNKEAAFKLRAAQKARKQIEWERLGFQGTSTDSDIAHRIDPRMKSNVGKIPIISHVRKFFDNSSDVAYLDPSDPEYIITMANATFGQKTVEAQGLITRFFATLSAKGDLGDMFGMGKEISARSDDVAKSFKVTHKKDGTPLDEAPYFGDVFEHWQQYDLTRPQIRMIKYIEREINAAQAWAYRNGVEIDLLKPEDQWFHYFPRYMKDDRGVSRIEFVHIRTGQRISPDTKRYHEFMMNAQKDSGRSYLGPEGALRAYFNGIYHDVHHKGYINSVSPLGRSTKIPEHILKEFKDSKGLKVRMESYIQRVKGIADNGTVPHPNTVNAMRRMFPELTDSINAVMRMGVGSGQKGVWITGPDGRVQQVAASRLDHIIDGVADDVWSMSNINKDRFKEAVLEIEDELGPVMAEASKKLEGSDTLFELALKRLTNENEKIKNVAAQVAKSNAALYTNQQKSMIHTLSEHMQQYVGAANARFVSAEQKLSQARKAGKKLPTERDAPAPITDAPLIFDSRIAERIEKTLGRQVQQHTMWSKPEKGTAWLRSMRTVFDFGAPMLQGLPVLMNDPGAWGRATAKHYAAFVDPKVRARYIAENSQDIIDYVRHGGIIGSSEFTEGLQHGGWFASIPTKIWEGGKIPEGSKYPSAARYAAYGVAAPPIKLLSAGTSRFGNSFETFLDVARVETWKGLRPLAHGSPTNLDDVAVFTNQLTGAVSSRALGTPLSQQEFESVFMFFAPRYFRATAALILDVGRGGLRGQLAQRAMTNLFNGMLATHYATNTALGQEVNLDPTKPGEFLTTEIGTQRVRFAGKPFSMAKTAIKTIDMGMDNPEGFLNWNILDAEAYRQNPWLFTLRSQGSLGTGGVMDLLTGANILGETTPGWHTWTDIKNVPELLVKAQGPFWGGAAIDGYKAEKANNQFNKVKAGTTGAAVGFTSEILGLTSYPVPPYALAQREYEEQAIQQTGKTYDELVKNEPFGAIAVKRMLLEGDKKGKIRQLEAIASEQDRHNLLRRGRQKERDAKLLVQTEYLKTTSDLATQFENQLLTPLEFRQELRLARNIQRTALREIRRANPENYEDQQEFYERIADESPAQAAMNMYFDAFDAPVSEGGIIADGTDRVDYDERERLIERIDVQYGEGTWAIVKNEMEERNAKLMLVDGKLVRIDPTVQERFVAADYLKPYWEEWKTVVDLEHQATYERWMDGSDSVKGEIERTFTNIPFRMYNHIVELEQKQWRFEDEIGDYYLSFYYGLAPINPENNRKIMQVIGTQLMTQHGDPWGKMPSIAYRP